MKNRTSAPGLEAMPFDATDCAAPVQVEPKNSARTADEEPEQFQCEDCTCYCPCECLMCLGCSCNALPMGGRPYPR
jgi:hypothetical protein